MDDARPANCAARALSHEGHSDAITNNARTRKEGIGFMDTSALVSIQDLLRDHEEQVAKAKRDAELAAKRAEEERAAAIERARAAEAKRARDAEAAAAAKRHEDERHAAEVGAMAAAAIARAKAEAEAAERMQVARANAEQEARLAAIANDRGKKRWRFGAVLAAVALGVAVIAGTTTLKAAHDREAAAEIELASMRVQIQNAENEKAALKLDLAGAHDPETIAKLTQQIAEKEAEIARLQKQPQAKKSATVAATAPVPTTATSTELKGCTCLDGDPACPDVVHCKIIPWSH